MGINIKVPLCLHSTLSCSNMLYSQIQVTPQQIQKVEQTAKIASFDDVSAHSFSHLQVHFPVLHLCIALVTLGPHPL